MSTSRPQRTEREYGVVVGLTLFVLSVGTVVAQFLTAWSPAWALAHAGLYALFGLVLLFPPVHLVVRGGERTAWELEREFEE